MTVIFTPKWALACYCLLLCQSEIDLLSYVPSSFQFFKISDLINEQINECIENKKEFPDFSRCKQIFLDVCPGRNFKLYAHPEQRNSYHSLC